MLVKLMNFPSFLGNLQSFRVTAYCKHRSADDWSRLLFSQFFLCRSVQIGHLFIYSVSCLKLEYDLSVILL
jgi:hypothetical protein